MYRTHFEELAQSYPSQNTVRFRELIAIEEEMGEQGTVATGQSITTGIGTLFE
jgi:hypothetical protein